ncbi:DinB family protein [Microaerobacter geothermalis]|uniref:DinB family protein n=1 Tax=Microaerobacter geothermalis TaxID=674972 RepID=UPI001F314CDA|nr:DinB family protein [Microaerobacter geothermalis]MCF6093056.1 DinB family protein [Microaerobacter geothermalis]
MIHSVEEFVSFFDGVRKRTLQYVNVLPESMMDWRPAEGKFSAGDILRHLGSAELMFLNIFEQGEWRYAGHDKEKGDTLQDVIQYMNHCHLVLKEGLLGLGDRLLEKKLPTLHGYEVSAWRLMMAMAEHEMHHRGQLATYLQMNGVEPPQIFGLKIEEVKVE